MSCVNFPVETPLDAGGAYLNMVLGHIRFDSLCICVQSPQPFQEEFPHGNLPLGKQFNIGRCFTYSLT